jgi:hypothetical protein
VRSERLRAESLDKQETLVEIAPMTDRVP